MPGSEWTQKLFGWIEVIGMGEGVSNNAFQFSSLYSWLETPFTEMENSSVSQVMLLKPEKSTQHWC